MQPSKDELDQVGFAFVTLGTVPFSPEERHHLTHFLHQSAIEFDEKKVQRVFKYEAAINAMKTLHNFASDYQEHEIMHEFNDEILDLLLNVNDMHGSMSI